MFDVEAILRETTPAEWLWPLGYRPTRWDRFVSRLRGWFR